MTADRWDTSAHLDDDPRRRRPSGRCYGAWHDATVALDSEAAKALGEIGRDRWRRACGDALPVPSATGDDLWPGRSEASRVGQECVSTCSARGPWVHSKKKSLSK